VASRVCTHDELQELLATANTVLRMDVEELARSFSLEELLEFWNMIKEDYKNYLRRCSVALDRDVDRQIRGMFRLAQLMIAASLRKRGEELPEITGQFTEQEYEILDILESMKEIEMLSPEDIADLIERREGKVYEIVKTYYEKAFHMLDTQWTTLSANLALALAEKYKERRRKIEEAVIIYMKRRPLNIFIQELEDVIRKALEAGEARRSARQKVDLALRSVDELEPIIAGAGSPEEGIRAADQALGTVSRLIRELQEERSRLEAKERELSQLLEQYKTDEKAREVLESELEALRSRNAELQATLQELTSVVEKLRAEKAVLEERLAELREGLEGRSEGHLVSSEEARALENAFIERVLAKIGRGAEVYNPVKGEKKQVSWSRREFYSLHEEGSPRGKGVQLQQLQGILRRRKVVVVDAVTVVHRDAYREKGWDSKPARLGEILDLLESRLEEATRQGYYHILAVSSPTGFTEKAKEYVRGGGGSIPFASKHLTLYLIDPVTGEVVYNPRDPAAQANLHLVEPSLPEERIMRVVEYVRSDDARTRAVINSASKPFLLVSDIVEATGEDVETVMRALHRLQEEGVGRLRATDKGSVAFFYNT